MTPYLIVAAALGWCAGMATAYYIGKRWQAERRARITTYDDANPLRDPEILAALKAQIAKWETDATDE